MKRLLAAFTLMSLTLLGAAPWATNLYLANGGSWSHRVPLKITNTSSAELLGHTQPYAIEAGSALIGTMPSWQLRIVDDHGKQLKYSVVDKNDEILEDAPITAGCTLYLPVSVGPQATTTYHIYYGNPLAQRSPDNLNQKITRSSLNGEFEQLDAKTHLPRHWEPLMTDAQHRVSVTGDRPASGRYCVLTEADKTAGPTWFKIGRALTVRPGATCTLKVKVRGEDTTGKVGWFVHVGNSKNPMMINRIAEAATGTFDWREVSLNFVVPDDADRLVTGSVLYGTGRAWFDNFSFDMTGATAPQVILAEGTPENTSLREIGRLSSANWYRGPNGKTYSCRIPVRIVNALDEPMDNVLASVDISNVVRNKSEKDAVLIYDGKASKVFKTGNLMMFAASVPPRTAKVYYLYTNSKTAAEKKVDTEIKHALGSDIPSDQILIEKERYGNVEEYATVMAGAANLLKNPSFEDLGPDKMPTFWEGAGEKSDAKGVVFGVADSGGFGKHHAFFTYPADKGTDWTGWRQRVPVKSGHRYVYGCWMSGENLDNKPSVHAHLCNDRNNVLPNGFASAGQSQNIDKVWKPVFSTVLVPADATNIQIHLTMSGHGTLRHDGALLAEVLDGYAEPIEAPATPPETVLFWQVDSVVKVFREDIPETSSQDFAVELARNEEETLQIAVRSGKGRSLKAAVEAPDGVTVTCGVVGYVPIDHKSAYYGSKEEDWIQLFPTHAGASDGWAGWWPDPVKPLSECRLTGNETQPFWFTFRTTADTRPGRYTVPITFTGDQGFKRVINVSLTVWKFALPEATKFPAVYDIRLNAQWNHDGLNGTQIRHELWQLMKQKKICPDSIGVSPNFKRAADGTITADFTDYDREAEIYFNQFRFPVTYTPGLFYSFGWAYPPKPLFGVQPFAGEYPWDKGESRATLTDEYKKIYQTCLRLYMDHMRAKGWGDRVVLYISDEPHFTHSYVVDQMKAMCSCIKEVEPNLPIYSSTWRHCKDWDGYISLWGAGHYGCFPEAEINERRAAGERFWFTTDGQMCTDTPYCAVERMLPHYCFKYGADAYEFWGCTWLTYDPWQYGWHSYIRQSSSPTVKASWTRYPAGDGYLIYPGKNFGGKPVTSIRLDAARDGVDDYEYLAMLKADASPAAQALLKQAAGLLTMPSAGGRFSSRFLPDPTVLQRLRHNIGEYLNAR